MKSPLSIVLFVAGGLGAGGLAASALAQTPAPAPRQPSPSQASPSQASPSQASPSHASPNQASPSQASPNQATTSPANPPGQSAEQGSPRGEMQGSTSERMSRFSPDDRAAFFDARVAAIHAGLRLTPDQEKLWPALESAARDAMRTMADLHEKSRTAGAPSNLVDRLQRTSDRLIARGQALKQVADAAQPLFATLTDEQKQRLPMLMRAGHHGWRERAGMGARERDGDRGNEGNRFDSSGSQHDSFRGSGDEDGFDRNGRGRDSGWGSERRRGFEDDRDFDRRDQDDDSGWRHGRGRGFDEDRDSDRRDRGYDSGWRRHGRGGQDDDRDYHRDSDRDYGGNSGRDYDRGGRGWDRD